MIGHWPWPCVPAQWLPRGLTVMPVCCRRSKRTRVQKDSGARAAHPPRRVARSTRGSPPAGVPGERPAVPPAIKRLLSHHGSRGVTRFRSVSLMVRTGRYDVTPHHFKRQVYLGSYETAEQAGRVADLAEVAAGKTGVRLNFEGEYGAEMERAAEVAAQPGMTDEAFKVRAPPCCILHRSRWTAAVAVDVGLPLCRLGRCRRMSTSKTSTAQAAQESLRRTWNAFRAACRRTSARWFIRTASAWGSTCQRTVRRVHMTK